MKKLYNVIYRNWHMTAQMIVENYEIWAVYIFCYVTYMIFILALPRRGSFYMMLYLATVNMAVCLSLSVSFCLSACMYVCLYLFVYQPVYLCLCLSVYVCLSIHIGTQHTQHLHINAHVNVTHIHMLTHAKQMHKFKHVSTYMHL